MQKAIGSYSVSQEWKDRAEYNKDWDAKIEEAYKVVAADSMSQAEVIGAVNTFVDTRDVMVCRAGSMPGDVP